MKKLALFFILLALVLAGCSGESVSEQVSPTAVTTTPAVTTTSTTPPPTTTPLQFGERYEVRVLEVLDGDTVDVEFPDGKVERVRLLCVDTPEKSAENNKPYEYDSITDLSCLAEWGVKAKEFAESKLEGKTVEIEFDSTAGLRGYYGRLLAYVYVNGEDFNAELVKEGYARVYEEGECRKESEYLRYQEEAKQSGIGLWSCAVVTTTTTTTTSTQNCDPSYPDVCIPPPPPDLDCKDIPYRNFRVLPPDPHHFDRDKDGIGCES